MADIDAHSVGSDIPANDLSNEETVTKYRVASDITNKVMKEVAERCVDGAKIVDVCKFGDDRIVEETSKVYRKKVVDEEEEGKKFSIEKGVAFPTCVCPNSVTAHFSPLSDDTRTLSTGDVVKVTVGSHIDGFVAVGTHTLVVGGAAATGAVADALAAANTAADVIVRMVKPGKKNTELTDALEKVYETFGVNPVDLFTSHETKQFVLEGNNTVLAKHNPEQKVEEFEFEENAAYQMHVVISTGEGRSIERDLKTTVYQRRVENAYSLKMKASRQAYSEICERFSTMPFSIRAMDEKKARLGLPEMVKHELVTPYPVLEERDGAITVAVQFTVLVLPNGPLRLINALPQQFQTEKKVEDETLKAILATSVRKSKKSKKNKKKNKKPAE